MMKNSVVQWDEQQQPWNLEGKPMAEGYFSKMNRARKRAFNFSSDERIRRNRDMDETSSNADYMISRGKKRTNQDQSDIEAGQRIHKRIIAPEPEETGIASNAMKSRKINFAGGAIRQHFRGRAESAPVVKLFKRLKGKKDVNSEMAL